MRQKKIVNEKERRKKELQELQQISYDLQQGLSGIYYKEYRKAQLLKAYDAINDLLNNKDYAVEGYQLRQATRDTVISFSNRKKIYQAMLELEKVLGINQNN